MADDIPALLHIEDAHRRVVFVNRAYVTFTGRSADMLMGDGWLHAVHPDDAPAVALFRSGAERPDRHEADYRMRRADGTYRWVRSVSVHHHAASGEFTGYVVLSVDVEDRKQAEKALAVISRQKDDFLAMLAHELRNPLAPIRNAAGVIQRVGNLDPRAAWATDVITRQCEQLGRILDDLLDVARITRGIIEIQREPVELSVVIAQAVEGIRPFIDSRRQRLSVAMPPAPVWIEGDVVRLSQVLENLLINATKYAGEGGRIDVELATSGGDALIRVEDNGIGISPDLLPRIFDLFTQAEEAKQVSRGGLGIGLTIVKRLVELHRGTVEARSAGIGKGSQFLVRLPLSSERSQLTNVSGQPRTSLAIPPKRILVIDDSSDNAETMATLMTLEGHHVRAVHSAASALEVAAAFKPQVIVMDIGMPGLNGYELAHRLRAQPSTANVPIIAVTAFGRVEDVERARQAGIGHHFVKPVDPEKLLASIGALTS
jgi:PAS domain S-box-containing protein